MSIVVIGVNHRTAPLAVLERLAIAPDDVAKSVAGLAQRDTIREVAVLSTCGRTEVYLVAERFHGAHADVTEFLAALGHLPLDDLHPHVLALHDDAAATHLFEVAAGLDSFVLGESEILGQVRSAWQLAAEAGGLRSTLDLLFRHALRTGKRARSETAIGRGTTSISHAAVELAADRLGTLAGAASSSSAPATWAPAWRRRSARRGRRTSRWSTAASIAAAPWPPRSTAESPASATSGRRSADSDVVVTCVAGSESLITADMLASRSAELLIVDIALPRNVDRAVAAVAGVTLLDLDDVRSWAERGRDARAAEAGRVRAIIADQLEQFLLDSTARQAAPLVARLHERAEQIRSTEVQRYSSRLGELGEVHHDAVEALTKSIVAKLLHEPSVRLRHDAGTPQGERNAAAVSDLFDLGSR